MIPLLYLSVSAVLAAMVWIAYLDEPNPAWTWRTVAYVVLLWPVAIPHGLALLVKERVR